MPHIILLRGPSGSGKSTLAKEFVKEGYLHFENDMWLYERGCYVYTPQRISDAIWACNRAALSAFKDGYDIVVSNTFTRVQHMDFFRRLTPKVTVVRCLGEFPNDHYVDPAVVRSQRRKMENLEGELLYNPGKK